jgi:hypothetical protein
MSYTLSLKNDLLFKAKHSVSKMHSSMHRCCTKVAIRKPTKCCNIAAVSAMVYSSGSGIVFLRTLGFHGNFKVFPAHISLMMKLVHLIIFYFILPLPFLCIVSGGFLCVNHLL